MFALRLTTRLLNRMRSQSQHLLLYAGFCHELPTTACRRSRLRLATVLLPGDTSVRNVQLVDRASLTLVGTKT